jgi:DNA-directed RNA polymerase specialized sigma24 family protein
MQPSQADLYALALRAASGDRGAFDQLWAACSGTIGDYVRYKLRGSQAADAVIAEIAENAWQQMGTYGAFEAAWRTSPADSAPVLVQHWLLRLARNAVVRQYRREAAQG